MCGTPRRAISIHALLAESDPGHSDGCIGSLTFLSTLSLRRATSSSPLLVLRYSLFLSTLSLRRATISMAIAVYAPDISIHALLAESDTEGVEDHVSDVAFLSTLSLRRATGALFAYLALRDISIHALLAESDRTGVPQRVVVSTISIHALLAESDLFTASILRSMLAFLSTLSLRRATVSELSERTGIANFYPRSPCGERQRVGTLAFPAHFNFYPRSPCGERRRNTVNIFSINVNFYPRSPCGERLSDVSGHSLISGNFYPRSPCGERRAGLVPPIPKK